jgi:hypothetical protein
MAAEASLPAHAAGSVHSATSVESYSNHTAVPGADPPGFLSGSSMREDVV